MKINYRLANGKVIKVEVTEEQAEVIIQTIRKAENNETKHRLRKTKEASLDFLSEEYDWEPTDGTVNVEAVVEQADEAERLRRAIACLTDKQQQVIQLHFYYGYSFVEIAEIMGISKSTVSRHYEYAKGALEKILKNF